MAEEHQVMTMSDWIKETDDLLKFRKKNILGDAIKISHKQTIQKANYEYEKFRINKIKNISQVWMKCIKDI